MKSNVFLCVSKEKNNFECKMFQSFLEADKYLDDNYVLSETNYKTSLIPVCAYMPEFLTKYVLERKINNTFRNKITII